MGLLYLYLIVSKSVIPEEPGKGLYTGDFERRVKEGPRNGTFSFRGSSVMGTWREDSFTGDSKVYAI
jgi:hypothetical protein